MSPTKSELLSAIAWMKMKIEEKNISIGLTAAMISSSRASGVATIFYERAIASSRESVKHYQMSILCMQAELEKLQSGEQ